MIISKINLKMIWIIEFLDFIFAPENFGREFQTTTISKYNTTHKMAFNKNIYNEQLLNPISDLGRLTIQVHERRQ
ncbi:hypothetical protein EAH81_24880 [Flavobacterium pectinovorum]|uniref:Uncharacterized protein n=1 Tax=Flavobacterium pectinovorum TaxID=29533 RepID=A0A502E8Z0_9FLAO|nr:hypothetical protein EAH81_24880 [Flavobacterium pectinovorum]